MATADKRFYDYYPTPQSFRNIGKYETKFL